MSLILEALRKSEERRRLGETPTLISESAWASRRRHPLARDRHRAWLLLPLLLVAGVAGWWLGWRGADRDDAGSRTAAVAPAPAPVATASPVLQEGPSAAAENPDAATPSGAPGALPQSAADAAATAQLDPETKRRFEAGEVFANSPDQLASAAPTQEKPYVPPEAALPAPLPEPQAPAVPDKVASEAVPAPPAQTPAPTAPPVATPVATPTPAPIAATTPPAPVATTPAPVAAAPSPTEGVPLLWQLPMATRKSLPPLVLSMHVYAQEPERRFAFIDGERVAEGSVLGNGLSVRTITPDGVVLELNGQPFVLPRSGR